MLEYVHAKHMVFIPPFPMPTRKQEKARADSRILRQHRLPFYAATPIGFRKLNSETRTVRSAFWLKHVPETSFLASKVIFYT